MVIASFFRVDTFHIECPIIGELTRVRIRHDNKGIAAGWFLDKVNIIILMLLIDLIYKLIIFLLLCFKYDLPCRWL